MAALDSFPTMLRGEKPGLEDPAFSPSPLTPSVSDAKGSVSQVTQEPPWSWLV